MDAYEETPHKVYNPGMKDKSSNLKLFALEHHTAHNLDSVLCFFFFKVKYTTLLDSCTVTQQDKTAAMQMCREALISKTFLENNLEDFGAPFMINLNLICMICLP